jgi:four helix bundle protein
VKSEELKAELEPPKLDISERSVAYSLRLINLYRDLEKDSVGRILGKQLLRAGTSVGANVHEAQGGHSRADFIAKMTIAYKEVREALYWLRLIQSSKLSLGSQVEGLLNETQQLVKILSSILLTSKKNGASRC